MKKVKKLEGKTSSRWRKGETKNYGQNVRDMCIKSIK